MTALTIAVPRMTRVTWYKHRVSMLGIPAVFLLAALLLFIDGILQRQWLSSNHLSGCLVQWQWSGNSICAFSKNAATLDAWGRFGNLTRTNVELMAALALPVAIGLFAGVPWVAREFESGAFRFTWAQAGSPRRWLLGTFAPLALLAGASAAVFGLALSWWYQVAQWRSGFSYSIWAWQRFESGPLSTVSWTLLAMSLALLIGVTIRRMLPAMLIFVLAIGGCATLSQTLLREYLFRIGQHVKPIGFTGQAWPNQFTTYVSQTWYTTKSGRPVSLGAMYQSLANHYHGSNWSGWLQQHYIEWIGYQPQSRVVWFELARNGVLVAVAALAVLAAVWWLRKRPAE
jgi:hypothetical protein